MQTIGKHSLLVPALVLWLASGQWFPATASLNFMKIESIPGEATAPGHEGEIEVSSFSYGFLRTNNVLSAAPLVVTKAIDKATPHLMLACANGTRIPTLELIVTRQIDDTLVESFRLRLTYVTVERIETKPAPATSEPTPATNPPPIEEVAFRFAIIESTYQPLNADGTPAGTAVGGTVVLPNLPQ